MINDDQNRDDAIIRSLQTLDRESNIGDDGSVKTTVTIDSHIADEILLRYVHIPDEVPERTRKCILLSAFHRWMKYKKYRDNPDLVAAFQEAVQVELNRIA
jgi:hypothetical protein